MQAGHAGAVETLAFTSDGKLLATAGADSSIILWDVASGHEFRSLDGGAFVNCVAFSADNKQLAAATGESKIKVWDVFSGKLIRELTGFPKGVGSLAFDSKGRFLAAGLGDGTIKFWGITDGRRLQTLVGHKGWIYAVAFSPDGRLLASAGGDKSVRLWEVDTGRELHNLSGHQSEVLTLSFSPDGNKLASGDGVFAQSGEVKIWSVATGRELRSLFSVDSEIVGLSYTPKNSLVSLGHGRMPELWDPATGRELRRILPPTAMYPRCLAMSNDGSVVAIGNDEGTIVLADVEAGKPTQYLPLVPNKDHVGFSSFEAPEPILHLGVDLKVSDDGRWLATNTLGGVNLWDLSTGTQIHTLDTKTIVKGVAFSPDAKWIATADYDNTIEIWDVTTGILLRTLSGHTKPVNSVAFTPMGDQLVSGSEDGTIKVWNTTTAALIRSWNYSNGPQPPSSLAISPDGRFVAQQIAERGVLVWAINTGQLEHTLGSADCQQNVGIVASSPSGRWIASNCGSAALVWNFRTGQKAFTLHGHTDEVTSLSFSSDSQFLASGSRDRTVRIWGAENGGTEKVLTGSTGFLSAAIFIPCNRWLVSIAWDGLTRIWDTRTGRQLCTLVSLPRSNDWLVAADQFFDGSQGAWGLGMWRLGNTSYDLVPLEALLKKHYRPSLLSDVLSDKALGSVSLTSNTPRTQTQVRLSIVREDIPANLPENVKKALKQMQIDQQLSGGGQAISSNRTILVQLEIQPGRTVGKSGQAMVQDARLFRNGSLVKMWRGEIPLEKEGKSKLLTPVTITAGENRLSAYVFDQDDTKSTDSRLTVIGSQELARKGTAYILSVGIDQYENSDFNLNYAVTDAEEFSDVLRNQLENTESFSSIKTISLNDGTATKSNFMLALNRFARGDSDPLPSGAPLELSKISIVQPEDAIFIYFVGHGIRHDQHFYLLPSDLGYPGERNDIDEASLMVIKRHSISDLELASAFERIDAGKFVLLIDSCNSGQVLGPMEDRRGPMNSQGLAQLAYEKGMYVLAAAQSNQDAFESSEIHHGLLTFALIEEGLKQGKAAQQDGQIYLRQWLDYSIRAVPELELRLLLGALQPTRLRKPCETVSSEDDLLQRPRVYYPREPEPLPFVIGRKPS